MEKLIFLQLLPNVTYDEPTILYAKVYNFCDVQARFSAKSDSGDDKEGQVRQPEVKAQPLYRGKYSFTYAQMLADVRKERTFTGEVKNRINRYMRKWQWSPEQIVGYCRLKGYAMVSVECISQ